MKIKTKLYLGIGSLFGLIILLALFSIKQINLLSSASENIIKDNNKTLGYTTNMLNALTQIDKNAEALNTFENYLLKQKSNITEVGENQLTQKLSQNFYLLQRNPSDEKAMTNLQLTLFEIMEINLNSIEAKNNFARVTAHKSIILISSLSLFCFIIALILLLKLPANILDPIKELITSTKKIAANDYTQRVKFVGHNELGELAVSFNTMASQLEQYNKSSVAKLLTEKRITETLINTIHYPIIGFNTTMKINLVNNEFLKVSGLNYHELIGSNILEMAPENDLISQIIIDGSGNHAISSLNAPDTRIHLDLHGKDIYYEKEVQEIVLTYPDERKGHLMGYVVILKNVTKYMELDLAKTNFIATVSHELKTPVSALKFSLQLLENEKTGPINPIQHELIKSCEEDANNLLKIISELLKLAQVETGNIQLNIMAVDLNDIVKHAINGNMTSAHQKDIIFKIDFPADLPPVIADKEKTAWVLSNIISNAIRYSGNHSNISIYALNMENKVKLCIRDFGVGIESQFISRIFDRYFTVPGTRKEGSGLGLAISKEFIEAQGGQISVESEPGVGSVFSIILNSKDS